MGAPAALGTQYSIRLDQSQGAQNIATNQTVVNWAAYAIKNSGSGYFSGSATSWGGSIGGVSVGGTLGSYDMRNSSGFPVGGQMLIASGSVTVTHNPDGTFTASSSFTWNADNPPALAPGTANDSFALTRIPRGPKVEVSGAWQNTIAYVEVAGAWQQALVYVEQSGAWVQAGG